MTTINHAIADAVLESDGRYLTIQELQPLEQYIQDYQTRLDVYQQLRDQGDKLVLQALRKMGQTYPDLIQQHGSRCKYDMTEVLRYIALSVLRDDEVFFKEQMSVWLDTILLAYKRTTYCATAYRYLQEAINHSLSAGASNLVRPYIDIVVMAFQAHV